MRYFIARNVSQTVVDKICMGGDIAQIDVLVNQFRAAHPLLTVTEVNQTSFDGTSCVLPPTPEQQAWSTFKATATPLQMIQYLAKHIGLE